MRTIIPVAIVAFIIGFYLADAMALRKAKAHGVTKYGGLLNNQPKAGKQP